MCARPGQNMDIECSRRMEQLQSPGTPSNRRETNESEVVWLALEGGEERSPLDIRRRVRWKRAINEFQSLES